MAGRLGWGKAMNGDELCHHYRRIRQRLYDPPAPPPLRLYDPPPPPPPPRLYDPPPAAPPPPPSPRVRACDDFLTVEKIIRTTCLEFGCSRAQLLQPSRKIPVVLRRFIAIGLAIRFARRSINQIGRHFQLDHSTVIYAGRRMQPVVDAAVSALPDATISELVREMRRRLEDDGWLGKRTWEDCPCAAAEPQ
jgi:hypothetical protein